VTTTIRHVLTILAVERLRESVDFYRAAFGWEASSTSTRTISTPRSIA
jgi:predicted enzyme related to lactoylglutathione lyase